MPLGSWLESLARDIRLGLRLLSKNASVTGAAIVSLSLALGACVAAFSLVDALILRSLPVRRPDQLIYLSFPTYSPERPEADGFSDPVFVRLREAARGRVDLFAMATHVMQPVVFGAERGASERVRMQFVSGDAFDLLGVLPTAGRLLTPRDDERPGAHPVAVLSHGFWMRRFGGDPAMIGRWFTFEERQFQIVGVAEPRFTGIEPGRPTDLWVPYSMYNARAFGNPDRSWFRILGRVNDNARPAQVQSVLQAAFTSVRREHAAGFERGRSPESVARYINTPLSVRSAANGPSPLRRQFERSLWILTTIALLVLLIAGSNLANLLLARAAAREREMSLRLSVGAGRGRLIQQVLVESALLAVAACALGVLFAALAAAPAVVGMLTSVDDPVHLDLRVDWRLVAFVGALTLLTTALFGLAPAVRASTVAPMTALKADGRSAGRAAMLRPFVTLQVAFSVVALFVGSLLVLSFARVSSVNPGFATSEVLLLSLETVQRTDATRQRTGLRQVLDRLRGIPGVEAVSSAEFSVLGRAWTHVIRVPGTRNETVTATMAGVTPGFFETMKIPLLAGRTFVDSDFAADHPTAVVVSSSLARRYFGGEPAIGRTFEGRFDDDVARHEVVGVVADTRYDLRKPAEPTLYYVLPPRSNGTLHVRVAGGAGTLASRLREEVRNADPLFRVPSVKSMAAAVDQTLLRERLLAVLAAFFAAVGLVVTAVGLYGVSSSVVVQRTREIGIRVALGARQLDVARTILTQAVGTTLVGAACGLAGGMYLSRFVQALLFEVTPLDFWSVALPLGAMLLAAAGATAVPALKAARIDPAIALRYD